MHPFLLSVFISCIYFELIFKMKSVDNTSANPRISIAGNAVPKKISATIVAATGSTLDNNPAYTLPAYFTHARYLYYTQRSYGLMRRILLLQCSRSSS